MWWALCRHRETQKAGHGPPDALSFPAPPQLPNKILSSSGQVGRVAGDEVVGCLAPFPFPAS